MGYDICKGFAVSGVLGVSTDVSKSIIICVRMNLSRSVKISDADRAGTKSTRERVTETAHSHPDPRSFHKPV